MTGPVFKSDRGYPIQNPYLSIANTALDHMRKFLIEFGMTPASRSKLRVVTPTREVEDPLEEFLREGTQARDPS
jgi:P27 family predicted phage terminase small subunit